MTTTAKQLRPGMKILDREGIEWEVVSVQPEGWLHVQIQFENPMLMISRTEGRFASRARFRLAPRSEVAP
jgi:hypothetical protein